MIRKSVSCEFYPASTSSDTSGTSSSSENPETPLKKFNRLVRKSVARRWAYWDYMRKDRVLSARGRSASDVGLCQLTKNDRDLSFLDIPTAVATPRRSLQAFSTVPRHFDIPELCITSSAGAGTVAVGIEEASDSEVERPRRHHLRVPTPALPSTGNFATGTGVGGGCGAPRSAPATPLQLEPHSKHKHDKHAVKPLSGSTLSVRDSVISTTGVSEAADAKLPSKSRQKKFMRHFPQVGPEERVLNYYACALVGDLLLQGHLYITKNYFAFYSNVFGYVTKLLIPITSVLRITKEKVARIIPNAVGVCTRDERHVFGSLLSRDATYKLMTHVWKSNRGPEASVPTPSQELRASEVELDASEYSPEDDSSSGGADHVDAPPPPIKRESEAIIATGGTAVIQPALLTGGGGATRGGGGGGAGWRRVVTAVAALLAATAVLLAYRLYHHTHTREEELLKLTGEELYSELVRWRTKLHGRAATELHAFLSTNLILLTKVRQSLEALSGVILTDMAHGGPYNIDVPNETAFS